MTLLSQTDLRQMNEANLRQKVIIPLMEKLGFRGVHEWHGGVGELGKDVVGWKEDAFGDRINVAVVAKATRISGAVVHEVTRQVRQAFNTPFEDPITHDQQFVHRVWIVTSKEVPTDSRPSVWSDLDPNQCRHVRIIDGDDLWSKWKHHFPVDLYEALEEAQRHLSRIDTAYKVEVSLTPDTRKVVVGERYPGQLHDKPLEFSGAFRFPNTPEGLAKWEEVRASFATGSKAKVPAEFVQFKFPEALHQLAEQILGGLPEEAWNIEISSAKSDVRVPIRIEFDCDDGVRVVLPYVELAMVQAGTEKISFTNETQAFSILVSLEVDMRNHSFRLKFDRKKGPIAVFTFLQLLKVLECLEKTCHVCVSHVETGLRLSDERREVREGRKDGARIKRLIEDLCAIQERVNRPIYFPDRDLTQEEKETIVLLRTILRDHEIEGTWSEMTLTAIGKAGDENVLLGPFIDGSSRKLWAEEEKVVTLFGTEISLGRVRTTVEGMKLINEREIRAQLAASPDEEITVQLRFEPGSNDKALTDYLDWGAESANRDGKEARNKENHFDN